MTGVRGIGFGIANRDQDTGHAGAQPFRPAFVRAHLPKAREQDVMQPLASAGPTGHILDGLDESGFVGAVP
jgi:hypothetical protein